MRKIAPVLVFLLLYGCSPDDPRLPDFTDTTQDENTVDTFSVKRPDHSLSQQDPKAQQSQSGIDSIINSASSIINSGHADTSSKVEHADFIVEHPDVAPYYPGGDAAMEAYFAKHLVYPLVAFQNEIKGMVYVKTIIEKDGSIGGMKVVKSLGYGCDDAAQDCIRGMPNWAPGQVAGVNVRTAVTIPVMFGGNRDN